MPWLDRVEFDHDAADLTSWPWTVPAMADLSVLELGRSVTYLVGENGTGKSTVLEAIACACGCPEEGGPSKQSMKGPAFGGSLSARTRPVLRAIPMGGAFFLRAESFFDIATAAERAASEQATYEDTQLLASFGWRSPHTLSHGQAFVGLFQGRMTGSSLWFMDEPEAALSFRSQLVLLAEMNALVKYDAQFVIATHSPVLTALPDARIYEFTDNGITEATWDDLDLVRNMRAFVADPHAFFRHLFDDR